MAAETREETIEKIRRGPRRERRAYAALAITAVLLRDDDDPASNKANSAGKTANEG